MGPIPILQRSTLPHFESLEDSCIDIINYASFFAAYMKGGIDGQEEDRDFLNRPIAGTGAPMKTDLADDIGAHDG